MKKIIGEYLGILFFGEKMQLGWKDKDGPLRLRQFSPTLKELIELHGVLGEEIERRKYPEAHPELKEKK